MTSADELMSRSWYAETVYGLKGELTFQGDTATLVFKSSEGDFSISGAISIDSKNFYITSTDFFRTYTFSYSVFFDRAEITYGEDTLTFYPLCSDETSAVQ